MPRPRLVTLEEKCEWMRKRQALKAQTEEEPAEPPRRAPSLQAVRRSKREVPSRFIMYTVAEVAEMFGVHPRSIRRWFENSSTMVRAGASGYRRHFLISQQDIDDFLTRHRSN